MPVFTPTVATGPRQELALAIVEGEGAVQNLIGERLMPSFAINCRTAHLPKLTLQGSNALRVIDDPKFLRAPGTKYERMVAKVQDATINTNLSGLEIIIPNETAMEWDAYLDLVAFFSARLGQEVSGLTKEKRIAATVFDVTQTSLGSAIAASAAYTVANRDIQGPLGMNPIQDIIGAARYLKSIGENPDTVAMSGPLWERVRTCQNTLQFVRGILGPIMEVNQANFLGALAEFGIKNVEIGDSYINTAADGATPSLSQIWSNTYIAVLRRGMASLGSEQDGVGVPTMAGYGVAAFWTGFKPGGAVTTDAGADQFAGGNYVETYPQMDINSLVVRVGLSQLPFVANNRCSVLISTSYA